MTPVNEAKPGNVVPESRQAAQPTSAPGGLLTPGEVAALFRVDPKTVTRWALAGRIGSIRTPGGHRRFHEAEVRALLARHAGIPQPTQGD